MNEAGAKSKALKQKPKEYPITRLRCACDIVEANSVPSSLQLVHADNILLRLFLYSSNGTREVLQSQIFIHKLFFIIPCN